MIVTQRERERERKRQTQEEVEAGCMHREPNVGLDPGSPGLHPGPKAGAKPLRHPGILEQAFDMRVIIPLPPRAARVNKNSHKALSTCLAVINACCGDPWVAQRFGACLWPRARSWGPRIESHIGLPVHGACFSLCLCLCLSLSL